MIKKVVGKISRELNREISDEPVNVKGPKASSGASLRGERTVSAPASEGLGPVYKNDDDDL